LPDTPKRDPRPHAEDTPQGSHTERPLEEPWNMRGSLPAERQAAYLDTNVLLSHRPQTAHTPHSRGDLEKRREEMRLTPNARELYAYISRRIDALKLS
jgi:hypothetical protein